LGFRKIFIGLLFMFDFRINGFDVLPDFIGYIFIFSGLALLVDLNHRFETAKNLVLPLIFLSLFDIYQVNIPIDSFSMDPKTFLFSLIGIISAIINILMIYNLCIGIEERAIELANDDLARLARSRWTLYLIFQITFLVVFIFKFIALLLFIPLFIFSIIVYIMMLNLMSTAENQLK